MRAISLTIFVLFVVEMTQKHFVVATAGHVDHGKSSLVKALTGTDPDRLPEEKARKITIDLGFAELNLRGPGGEEIHAAMIDVPGHEDFVRNMIAGVGSIDLALLVVAADDGWMPQTEEHLQILEYLGVTEAVIALTKIDISNADRTESEIREQLRGTNFADAPIVRTSFPASANLTALSRQVSKRDLAMDGIAALKAALATALCHLSPQRDIGKPRLFVDRAFTLRGIGTVVTGTLTGGTLRVGDEVIVQPRTLTARIRSIQNHGRDVDLAMPGMRTAINLSDVEINRDVARGDVLTVVGFEASSTLDVQLQRSLRLQHVAPIKSGATAYLHHGTTRIRARIFLHEDRHLHAGENAAAQLRLDRPVLAFLGDRFVIRDASEQHTLAGGMIRNADADQNNVDLCVVSELSRRGAARTSLLLRNSRFSADEIHAALERLQREEKVFLHGDIAVAIENWHDWRRRAATEIDREHRAHPEKKGMELHDLRANFAADMANVFDALIVDLCRDD
ncbi:MAG TPA: selenocysteine-specific translation elongation factor, partial [Chthoniobacterales bacterium]|nr:selenocysteine-specific translation elongation factor [Chthoniobacterales bacterium]